MLFRSNRGRQDRAGASADKSTKLPDPDTLDDGKEPRFEDWLARVKNKLKVNADHFLTEEFKRAYVIGRVTGKAARYIAPRIREDSADPYRSAEDVYQHLATKFDDPNRVFNAKNDFKKLYMRDLPFHDFYADFIHLASEAQISTTDLKYELNLKLATELQLCVIREFQDPEYTLQKFADYCTVIDQAVKSASARLRGRNQNQNRTTGKETTDNAKDKPKVTENSGPGQANPGSADRDRLCQEGKCFYCKEQGHRAFECEKKKQDTFRRLNSIKVVESGPEQTETGKDLP